MCVDIYIYNIFVYDAGLLQPPVFLIGLGWPRPPPVGACWLRQASKIFDTLVLPKVVSEQNLCTVRQIIDCLLNHVQNDTLSTIETLL